MFPCFPSTLHPGRHPAAALLFECADVICIALYCIRGVFSEKMTTTTENGFAENESSNVVVIITALDQPFQRHKSDEDFTVRLRRVRFHLSSCVILTSVVASLKELTRVFKKLSEDVDMAEDDLRKCFVMGTTALAKRWRMRDGDSDTAFQVSILRIHRRSKAHILTFNLTRACCWCSSTVWRM